MSRLTVHAGVYGAALQPGAWDFERHVDVRHAVPTFHGLLLVVVANSEVDG
jgi:hypothetical protein